MVKYQLGFVSKGVVFHLGGNPAALVMSHDIMHKLSAAGMNGPAITDSNVLLYLEMNLLMPPGSPSPSVLIPHRARGQGRATAM